MRIRAKLILANLIISLFVVLVGGGGFYAANQIKQDFMLVAHQVSPTQKVLERLRVAGMGVVTSIRQYPFITTTEQQQQKHIPANETKQLEQTLALYQEIVKQSPDYPFLKELSDAGTQLIALGNQLMQLKQDAISATEAQQKRDQFQRVEKRFFSIIDAAIAGEMDKLRQQEQLLQRQLEFTLNTVFSFLLLALLLALLLSFFQARSILNPILLLEKGVKKVGQGKLEERIKVTSEDELEELASSFNTMVESLKMRLDGLVQAKERAEQSSQEKSEFLANMSHELLTSVHSILSLSHLGIKKMGQAENEKILDYFEKIHGRASGLFELLNSLLELSKLEAGQISFDPAKVELKGIVERSIAELSGQIEARGVEVLSSTPRCDTHAWLDYGSMVQVVENLLSNALKFTPGGSQVVVSYREDILPLGRRKEDKGSIPALRLTIQDEGIGIPKEELVVIFDKFTQGSKAGNDVAGSGLGLAICKSIVSMHRGVIWAESPEGGGATFHVVLPRRQA